MRKIILLLLSVTIITSCASTTRQMQRGDYDRVIQKSVKKLIRKPSLKYADAMDRAYKLANERDLERVNYLERENNPDYFDELYARYASLKQRQAQVRRVTPLSVEGKTYHYEYIDYDAKIIESKNKAAEYFYKRGKALMDNALSKEDYREAYENLIRAKEYGAHKFPDVDQLIYDARLMGISRVIVIPENRDPYIGIPEIDLDYLVSFDTRTVEGNPWTEFHLRHIPGNQNYDYEMFVRIVLIEVSDNIEKETKQEYKKKSTKEFDYILDAKGNVMKDTAGNDIKVYKDVFATLIKKERIKTCTIRGEVEIISISGDPKGSLVSVPFTSDSKFNNFSYDLIGKEEAVDDEILEKVKRSKTEPFPTETEMVKLCIENAKPTVQGIMMESGKQYIR